MSALNELSIAAAGAALRAGKIKARALTADALARVAALDPKLNAFILVLRDRALTEADAADADFKSGRDRGPFQGIPYGLKDIYDLAGTPTTCHSKLRLDAIAKTDSVVAAKLRDGGAVLLGKLATHEFAIGGPSFDLPFPPARNPWDLERMPGGSSSGSAAAVASGICRMAMGSDTGGSIRGPAAWCGTVGLKPTYGLVSRRGVFPLSYTLDHCGPLTWTVDDAAITMDVIAGHDPLDPASANVPPLDFRRPLGWGVKGLKIGIPRNFYVGQVALVPEVAAAIEQTATWLRAEGAVVEDVTLPDYDLFAGTGRMILNAEAYAVHERDLGTRPLDYGLLSYFRLMAGAFLTSADLTQAFRVRAQLTEALNRNVLTRYDALLTPPALVPAPRFDETPKDQAPVWPIQTIPWNLTGSPSLCVPVGFTPSKLPLGVQLVGRPFEDPLLLRIGAVIEAAAGVTSIRPEISKLAA